MLRIFLVIDDYNELIYLQSLLKKMGFDVEGLQNQKKYADLSLGFNPQVLITTAKGQKVDGLLLAKSITKRRGIPKILALRTPGANLQQSDFDRAGIDQVLDSPINPKKLLLVLATIGGIDETGLIDKYNKIKSSVITEEDVQAILVHDDSGQTPGDIQRVKEALEKAARERGEGPAFSVKNEPGEENAREGVRFPLDGVPDSDGAGAAIGAKSETSETPNATDLRKERFDKWLKEMGQLPPNHFDRDRIGEFNKKIRAGSAIEDIDQIEDERREYVKALFKNQK